MPGVVTAYCVFFGSKLLRRLVLSLIQLSIFSSVTFVTNLSECSPGDRSVKTIT